MRLLLGMLALVAVFAVAVAIACQPPATGSAAGSGYVVTTGEIDWP